MRCVADAQEYKAQKLQGLTAKMAQHVKTAALRREALGAGAYGAGRHGGRSDEDMLAFLGTFVGACCRFIRSVLRPEGGRKKGD